MPNTIPDSHADLLKLPAFAHLATTMKDGTPQVSPVWFSWDGKHILVNTAKGRVKDKNLTERPAVAIAISDPANPYRYLGIRGRVVSKDDSAQADADIDALAKHYMGVDSYPFRTPTEQRVTYRIEVTSAYSMG